MNQDTTAALKENGAHFENDAFLFPLMPLASTLEVELNVTVNY